MNTQPNNTCPQCGYCPTCGRSNNNTPYPFTPFYVTTSGTFPITGSNTTAPKQIPDWFFKWMDKEEPEDEK